MLKIRNPVFLILIVICIIYIYIIPYNYFSFNFAFLPTIMIIILLYFIRIEKKLRVSQLLFLIIMAILVIINIDVLSFINFISILIYYFYFDKKYNINSSYTYLNWMAFFGIIIQLMLNRQLDGRYIMSIGDPNFTGLIVFLFFLYSNKIKFVPGLILSYALILVLLSRNYFLAIVVFYLFKYLKFRIPRILLKVGKFGFITTLTTSIILFISMYWINNVTPQVVYDSTAYRLFSFNDLSNYHRFNINYTLYNYLINNFNYLLWGMKDLFEPWMKMTAHGIPHNSVIYFIGRYGVVFSSIYFFLLSKIINRYFDLENYEYIISYIVFSLFLHGAYNSVILLFFLCITSIRSNENRNEDGIYEDVDFRLYEFESELRG